MQNKITIAVSSCLLGEAVRYDGTDKRIEFITEQLAKEYNLISVCPEMAIGMGVPRPPNQLVDDGKGIQALGVDDATKNVTKPLIAYGHFFVETHADICGYIFKKNSPSCGIKDVKVFRPKGSFERRGQGVFAATVFKLLPLLPIIDEEDCMDARTVSEFKDAVLDYSKTL